jgi:hypothetical protein
MVRRSMEGRVWRRRIRERRRTGGLGVANTEGGRYEEELWGLVWIIREAFGSEWKGFQLQSNCNPITSTMSMLCYGGNALAMLLQCTLY